MADWVNVFEKAVLDMKAEGLSVELKSIGWQPFRKEQFDSQRDRNVCWGQLKGEHESR